MKLLRTLTMFTVLASTTLAFADNKPAPAPPAADKKDAQEISQADAEKFLAFFNKLVDAVVANKDDCAKLAAAVNNVIDTNKDMIAKANEAKAAGKKLPKALEDKMKARVMDMAPGMKKCQTDKAVQAAFMRMDAGNSDKKSDKPTPVPPASSTPPPKK